MKNRRESSSIFLAAALALGTLCIGQAGAVEFKIVPTSVTFEAGSGLYQQWPGGGVTWHSGIGYIEPFGQASYSCGVGYAEAKANPIPAHLIELVKSQTADTNPLFCIYTLKTGTLFVYDAVVGNVFTDSTTGERKDQLINIIVGGTGEFSGASGFWEGVTQGRGTQTSVASGQKLPVSILKLMSGHLRLPKK
ncbi:MAG: hypothetical protein QM808_04240 [Steroidobacteraceae bacterium]